MRVVLYARTSTADRQNPEVQLLEMRSIAAQRQWDIVNEFVDTVSGARECRPALDNLLKEAWKGKFQAIVVTRLDRLGRSLSHLIRLLNDLSQQNVALVSLKEQIDLSTSNGRLLFHIFGAIGQFERDLIVERVKRGIAYAKYCGIRVGRPPTINERLVATALEMKASGSSIRTIARTLAISPSGAHKIIAKAQLPTTHHEGHLSLV